MLFRSLEIPYVFLDAVFCMNRGLSPWIIQDGPFCLGAPEGKGHRRVGMFSDCGSNFIARERAFRESTRLLGLDTKKDIVRVQHWLRPRGMWGFSPAMQQRRFAHGVLEVNDTRRRGHQGVQMQHPSADEVSVIGFDDLPMSAPLLPPLTTLTMLRYRLDGLPSGLVEWLGEG